MHKPLAVVMGDMDLIRPLGLAGIPCCLVGDPNSEAARSRHVVSVITHTEDGIADNPEPLLSKLVAAAERQTQRPVLFYQHDPQLLFVSRNRDVLSQHFRFVMPDAAHVENLVDKGQFQGMAEVLELPVPPGKVVAAAVGVVLPDLGIPFPVVAKPLWRNSAWTEPAKVVQLDTPHDFRKAWRRWAVSKERYLVQQMIAGPETAIESYHCYVDDDVKLVAEFTGRKIRTYPVHHGHSTSLTLTKVVDLLMLGRRVVKQLGLRGVAKLDFKRDAAGELHLLEVNPRFNLWHHLGAVGGVNLPALVYNDLTGAPRSERPDYKAGVRWCRFTNDWKAARENGISFSSWLPWAIGCQATSLTWDDPKPFAHSLWRTVSGKRRSAA